MTADTVAQPKRRYQLSQPYLAGKGIEIGGGGSPQSYNAGTEVEHFDLRTRAELAKMFNKDEQSINPVFDISEIRKRFPAGADFLVAHNVLEHCPNPIPVLLEWTSYVRDSGTVVVSVPTAEFCPDKGRMPATIEHILLDYLFDRDGTSFECREHAYSCAWGWMNTWPHWLPEDKEGVARLAHSWASKENLDAHWHAFTPELFEQLFNVANLMSPRLFSPIMIAHPYLETANKTICDILYVFRVETRSTSAVSEELENHGGLNVLRSLDEKLSKALEKLRNLLLTKPTSALDQKGVH